MSNEVSLYGLVSDLRQVEEAADCDEMTLEKQTRLIELIKSKTDAVVGYRNSLNDYELAIENRIKELKEMLKVTQNKSKRFEEYILSCMDQISATEIRGSLTKISIRKPVEHVTVYDENSIPDEYFRYKTTKEVDKQNIKKDLKDGLIIPGVLLEDGKRSLIIK